MSISGLKRLFTQEGMSKPIDKNELYDLQTFLLMRKVLKRDSNCVDVGSHTGKILRWMVHLSPKGIHFAFEPLPHLYRSLIESFSGVKNVLIYDYALSESEGVSRFQHVITNPGYSGFLRRRYDRENEVVEEISVRVQKLDNLIPENVRIDFIKVDVEGAEFLVFKGATRTIKRSRPFIVFEHGLGGTDFYGYGPEDVYEILSEECGLKIYLISDWLSSPKARSLNLEEFRWQFETCTNYYFLACP